MAFLLLYILCTVPSNSFIINQMQSLQSTWKASKWTIINNVHHSQLQSSMAAGPRTSTNKHGLLHNGLDHLWSDSTQTADGKEGGNQRGGDQKMLRVVNWQKKVYLTYARQAWVRSRKIRIKSRKSDKQQLICSSEVIISFHQPYSNLSTVYKWAFTELISAHLTSFHLNQCDTKQSRSLWEQPIRQGSATYFVLIGCKMGRFPVHSVPIKWGQMSYVNTQCGDGVNKQQTSLKRAP